MIKAKGKKYIKNLNYVIPLCITVPLLLWPDGVVCFLPASFASCTRLPRMRPNKGANMKKFVYGLILVLAALAASNSTACSRVRLSAVVPSGREAFTLPCFT